MGVACKKVVRDCARKAPRAADLSEEPPAEMRRSIQKTMLLALDSSRNSSSERRRATRFLSPGASSAFSPPISASRRCSVARTAMYKSP